MTPTNFDELAAYLRNKVEELNDMCSKTDPWVFLCASAFIDYLSKLASGRNSKKAFERYPQFIKDFFPAKYDKFSYLAGPKSNETSLPHQMYYVLRCGIVHSFSFVPEQPARRHGGRPGSVLIAHRKGGGKHLDCIPTQDGLGAALLLAEDFVSDIAETVETMIRLAGSDANLKRRMLEWNTDFPPIGPVKITISGRPGGHP